MSHHDSLFVEVLKSRIHIAAYMYRICFIDFVYRAYFGPGEKGRESEL